MTAKAPDGSLQRFLQSILDEERAGDDCILWPFRSRVPKGYGTIRVGGRSGGQQYVHAIVCEHFHGPRPPGQQVRHLCGPNPSCVNPRHLAWGTPGQNAADKIGHGTRTWGEGHSRAKLSQADVDEIRRLHAGGRPGGRKRSDPGLRQWQLAERFGVSQKTISKIVNGSRWTG